MTDDRHADSIRAPRRGSDSADRRYVPPALRPVRARGLLAGLVVVFAAALVLTLGLPFFA
jgi:hypothetical protein